MLTPRAKFEQDLRTEYGASPVAIRLVSRLCDLYEDRGILPDGRDEPLCRICPNHMPCWAQRGSDDEYPDVDKAGISAPFIGADYDARRICIVAINLKGGGGLQDVWYTSGLHINAQRAGRKSFDNRPFAYAMVTYARLVEGSLDGEMPDDWRDPEPEALVSTWDSCAFVEAVKCAPKTHRGQPYTPMYAECPPFLLIEELKILAPRVVLLLGRGPLRDAVRPLLDVEWDSYPAALAHPGSIERDKFKLNDRPVELFSCNHPASLRWRSSLEQLFESLTLAPLA